MVRAKSLCLFVIFAVLSSVAPCRAQVTLYRDRYGVPSIVADKVTDAVYGLGYVMAKDDAVQMARSYKLARGRLAEVDGKSQLLADGFLRSLGIEEMAERHAQEMKGEEAALIQRFCEGANKALAEQKARLPAWITPFTPTDVLALAQMTNAAFPLLDIASQLLPGTGSNQFAVAPQRSATGHAILSADPHLSWNGPIFWYEFTLHTKAFAFHGVTAAGLPLGVMGHTDRVAWCMTNNDPDLFDFYKIEINPKNPKQYNYHGQWRDFEDTRMEMRYLEDGQLKSRSQLARRTAWGPMVPFRMQAVRLSMLGSWSLIPQTLRMAQARDAKQFREALRPLGLSMWNLVYADTQGHIGYQFNAHVPHRDAAFDWTKPVPGSDPRTQWGSLWTLDELPHVENPKSGLLVNCNSAPWLTPQDDEIRADGWPTYITTYGHTTRYDRLSALLRTHPRLTVEEAKTVATDTEVPYARKTVAVLAKAGKGNADLEPALRVLSEWNSRADTDARGCGLFYYWLRADKPMLLLAKKAESGTIWSAEETASALTALKKASTDSMQQFGRLDIPWGTLHIGQRGDTTAPVSGFGYVVGDEIASAVVPNRGAFRDGKALCNFGSSFRMIVELDPKGVRSWTALTYGNATDPQNPHYADQLEMFGRGAYKDTLFGLKRITKEAVSRQVLH